MMPALQVLRNKDKSALQPSRSSSGFARPWAAHASILVVSEIAISMLLVVGALNVAIALCCAAAR